MTGRSARTTLLFRVIAAFAIGAAGAAVLSIVTSQGYLHATVVTGAGYTGRTEPIGPGEQALMLGAWIVIGAIAGYVGRSGIAFPGLWVGALVGSIVGFLGDPDGNILWLDFIVTVVGVSLFLTPGFFLGAALAAHRQSLAPDGSGRRPTPQPLWTRGRRLVRSAPEPRTSTAPPPAAAPASYAPSKYARPGSQQPE